MVRDGNILDIPCKLQVLHTPGHTPGSIALYHADKKILFSGDSIWNQKTYKIAQGFFNTDDEEMMQSVKKYLDLDIEKIYVGHGRSILNNGGEQLKTLLGG
jgi:glyoxylase-like metal-dependent hydrolase (beta-lactamase superfamily II)